MGPCTPALEPEKLSAFFYQRGDEMTNTLIDTIVGKIAADLMDRVEADGFCLHKSSIEDVCRKVLSVELYRPVVAKASVLDEYGRTVAPSLKNLTASEIKARYIGAVTPKAPPAPKPSSDILDGLKAIDKIKADMIDRTICPPGISVEEFVEFGQPSLAELRMQLPSASKAELEAVSDFLRPKPQKWFKAKR